MGSKVKISLMRIFFFFFFSKKELEDIFGNDWTFFFYKYNNISFYTGLKD